MTQAILFASIFIIVYLFYLLFVINRKKMIYLKYHYKLNLDKINIKQLAHVIGLSNALIMATVVTVISFIKGLILQMLLCLILLIPFILIVYHIIGKYYQKKLRRNK